MVLSNSKSMYLSLFFTIYVLFYYATFYSLQIIYSVRLFCEAVPVIWSEIMQLTGGPAEFLASQTYVPSSALVTEDKTSAPGSMEVLSLGREPPYLDQVNVGGGQPAAGHSKVASLPEFYYMSMLEQCCGKIKYQQGRCSCLVWTAGSGFPFESCAV
jgi:hypothetical protein